MPFGVLRREPVVVLNHPNIAESSGTFGAGSGWLLRLTTDQMRRERGG
jgi:hypothetical protein